MNCEEHLVVGGNSNEMLLYHYSD